ncbi:MAG: single-stranded-DNA-specific exonuclease RecJ [Pseudomonadales bacterium]|nr:single-stranded-DNA-specific exonuclease RecJ [Pseudomonadales bacterium]
MSQSLCQTIARKALCEDVFSDSVPPLLKRLLIQRGVGCDAQIKHELSELSDPFLMKGMQGAVRRLLQALQAQQKVIIVGDFDADGATSTALMLLVLQRLGFQQVSFMVPNRFEYGYGLSEAIVDELALQKPDLLVTVDNGISSIDGVKKAADYGIDVVITDHHLPGRTLPEAVAIVNPNQHGCEFPSKAMAGVGVVFHLLMALRKSLRELQWFETQNIAEPNLADYLDLVALGTVADVVPLDFYNRILVAQGIKRIRAGRMRPGIQQLLQVAGKDYRQVCSADMGFALGPRLNAAGRLDDMSQGILLLSTDSSEFAFELAQQMDAFNRDRRLIEGQMQIEALAIVDALMAEIEEVPRALCLFHEDWHQGVVGLVASRLKEKFHRPVIAFAKAENIDGQVQVELKGSGRSIAGIHLRDILDEVATKNPGLLNKFGGHAMAAGLSLAADDFEQFQKAFLKIVDAIEDASIFEPVIETDGALQAYDLNLYNALMIRDAMPWGQGLPEPVFEGEFYMMQQRILKEAHLKCELAVSAQSGETYPAILFNTDVEFWSQHSSSLPIKVQVVYRLSVNTFRGVQSLQLMIQSMGLSEGGS